MSASLSTSRLLPPPAALCWRVIPRVMLLGLALLAAACEPNGAHARGVPDSLSPLVKKVLPSVVNIAV
ncbi:MAG TPA: hypothetical protein PLD10_13945, partial [Rhodopila sp.]|nr:hypothetical protein [Rhodopila sp.]